jgi:hypothetical protein
MNRDPYDSVFRICNTVLLYFSWKISKEYSEDLSVDGNTVVYTECTISSKPQVCSDFLRSSGSGTGSTQPREYN